MDALQSGLDIGAAGSRLLRGHTQSHHDLEDYAARFFKAGKALYFSSGFQANYALLTALAQRGDVVLYDSLVHASMREGLQSSKAKSFKFVHNDVQALEDLLKRQTVKLSKGQRLWIAIETVYSMDGDLAPFAEIMDLAHTYGAYVMADEAHATGIYGDSGRGKAWDYILKNGYDRLITIHTCGKAIGVAGGLVCATQDVIDFMINTSRAFIYSTAPMPLQAVLVQKSLDILSGPQGDERRAILQARCRQAKALFGGEGTHIVPIILGEDEKAVRVAQAMQEKGYDIRAIRPPTVPEGEARLRLSLSSELSEDVLQSFQDALKEVL